MSNSHHQIRVPDIAESIFDIGYLIFAFVTAVRFYLHANGSSLLVLCGTLALVLGGGDAFHLLPRVKRALAGTDKRTERLLGLGLFVSSETMTVFYLILFEIWKTEFPDAAYGIPIWAPVLLWTSALFRMAVCLFPQNNWFGKEGNIRFSLLRNVPFAITGMIMIVLFLVSGNADGLRLWRMSIAIAISFACYFPVTLLSKKQPKIGMLMIPKTCAYIWMLVLLGQFI